LLCQSLTNVSLSITQTRFLRLVSEPRIHPHLPTPYCRVYFNPESKSHPTNPVCRVTDATRVERVGHIGMGGEGDIPLLTNARIRVWHVIATAAVCFAAGLVASNIAASSAPGRATLATPNVKAEVSSIDEPSHSVTPSIPTAHTSSRGPDSPHRETYSPHPATTAPVAPPQSVAPASGYLSRRAASARLYSPEGHQLDSYKQLDPQDLAPATHAMQAWLHARQHPQSCADSKFLVFHDFNSGIGSQVGVP
jgi:hypothetical protein